MLPLWDAAIEDPDAAVVFLDALLERPDAWRDERVMMLCLGVPIEVRAPTHLGEVGRRNWARQRRESIAFAQQQRHLYIGRNDYVRAILAVLLFGDWRTRGTSGASPWAIAREADEGYQRRLVQRRERRIAMQHFRAAREVRENALRAVRRERTAGTGSTGK